MDEHGHDDNDGVRWAHSVAANVMNGGNEWG